MGQTSKNGGLKENGDELKEWQDKPKGWLSKRISLQPLFGLKKLLRTLFKRAKK